MAPLIISTDIGRRIAVVHLEGEFDLAGAEALEAEVEAVAADDSVDAVVVDLSRLVFMDSTGLRTLVLLDRTLTGAGKTFALVPGEEPVQRVFTITRMDQRLRFVDRPDGLV